MLFEKVKDQTMKVLNEAVEKVEKVTSNWAKLIARIYEVNPLFDSPGQA